MSRGDGGRVKGRTASTDTRGRRGKGIYRAGQREAKGREKRKSDGSDGENQARIESARKTARKVMASDGTHNPTLPLPPLMIHRRAVHPIQAAQQPRTVIQPRAHRLSQRERESPRRETDAVQGSEDGQTRAHSRCSLTWSDTVRYWLLPRAIQPEAGRHQGPMRAVSLSRVLPPLGCA